MKKNFIIEESEFLTDAERILLKLISDFAKNNRGRVDVFMDRRIKNLINRSFQSESEFLHKEPKDYYDYYCQDQNLN